MAAIEDAFNKINESQKQLEQLTNNVKTHANIDIGNVSTNLRRIQTEIDTLTSGLEQSQRNTATAIADVSVRLYESLEALKNSGANVAKYMPQLEQIKQSIDYINSTKLTINADNQQDVLRQVNNINAAFKDIKKDVDKLGSTPSIDALKNQLNTTTNNIKNVTTSIQAATQALENAKRKQEELTLNLKNLDRQFESTKEHSKNLEQSLRSLFTSFSDSSASPLFEGLNSKLNSLNNDLAAIKQQAHNNISTTAEAEGTKESIQHFLDNVNRMRNQADEASQKYAKEASLNDIQTLYGSLSSMNDTVADMSKALIARTQRLASATNVEKERLIAEINKMQSDADRTSAQITSKMNTLFEQRLAQINVEVYENQPSIYTDMANASGLSNSWHSNVSGSGQAARNTWQNIVGAEYTREKSWNPFNRTGKRLENMKTASSKVAQMQAEYEMGSSEIDSLFAKAEQASQEGNNEARDELLKRAKTRYKSMLALQMQINQQTQYLGKQWTLMSDADKKRLGEEGKAIERNIKDMFSKSRSGSNQLIALKEAHHIDVEEKTYDQFKKTTKAMNELGDEMEKTGNSSAFDEAMSLGTKLINKLLDIGGMFKNLFAGFGISSAFLGPYDVLTTMYGMHGEQGKQRFKAMGADAYLGLGDLSGSAINAQARLMRGNALFVASGGQISQNAINDSYMSLVRNVGGVYGTDASQASSDLDKIANNMALYQNVYGIDQSTVNDAIKTYYKDMRMSADEASVMFAKLTQTAQAANVPLNEYLKVVSGLAQRYMGIGLTGDIADNVLNNLMSRGMRIEVSSEIADQLGGAMSKFADNKGEVGFAAALNGQNPWEAIANAAYTHDEKGDPRKGWAQEIAKGMDTMFNARMAVYGNDPNFRRMGATDLFKQIGFGQRAASTLASAYLKEGANSEQFQELIQQFSDEKDNPNATLEKQHQKMLEQLQIMGGQLAASDRIEAEAKGRLYANANSIGSKIDSIVRAFSPFLLELQKQIIKISTKLAEKVRDIVTSDLFKSIMNKVLPLVKYIPHIALALVGAQAIGALTSLSPTGILLGGAAAAGVYGLYKKITSDDKSDNKDGKSESIIDMFKSGLSSLGDSLGTSFNNLKSAFNGSETGKTVGDAVGAVKNKIETTIQGGTNPAENLGIADDADKKAQTAQEQADELKKNLSDSQRNTNRLIATRNNLSTINTADQDKQQINEGARNLEKRIEESAQNSAELQEQYNQATEDVGKAKKRAHDNTKTRIEQGNANILSSDEQSNNNQRNKQSTENQALNQQVAENYSGIRDTSNTAIDEKSKQNKEMKDARNTGLTSGSESLMKLAQALVNQYEEVDTEKVPVLKNTGSNVPSQKSRLQQEMAKNIVDPKAKFKDANGHYDTKAMSQSLGQNFTNNNLGTKQQKEVFFAKDPKQNNKQISVLPNKASNTTSGTLSNIASSPSSSSSSSSSNSSGTSSSSSASTSVANNSSSGSTISSITNEPTKTTEQLQYDTSEFSAGNISIDAMAGSLSTDNSELATKQEKDKSRRSTQDKHAKAINKEQATNMKMSKERNQQLDKLGKLHEHLMGAFQNSVTEGHGSIFKMLDVSNRILVDLQQVISNAGYAIYKAVISMGSSNGGSDGNFNGPIHILNQFDNAKGAKDWCTSASFGMIYNAVKGTNHNLDYIHDKVWNGSVVTAFSNVGIETDYYDSVGRDGLRKALNLAQQRKTAAYIYFNASGETNQYTRSGTHAIVAQAMGNNMFHIYDPNGGQESNISLNDLVNAGLSTNEVHVLKQSLSESAGSGSDVDNSQPEDTSQQSADGTAQQIRNAVQNAINIANDNSHGYSTANRDGGVDYDCTSLISHAYDKAGIKVLNNGQSPGGESYEQTMKAKGFSEHKWDGKDFNKLMIGDILLNDRHAAMYIGDGKIVDAQGQDFGSNAQGDQGTELVVRELSQGRFNHFLRYGSGGGTGSVSDSSFSSSAGMSKAEWETRIFGHPVDYNYYTRDVTFAKSNASHISGKNIWGSITEESAKEDEKSEANKTETKAPPRNNRPYAQKEIDELKAKGKTDEEAKAELAKKAKYQLDDVELLKHFGMDISKLQNTFQGDKIIEKLANRIANGLGPNGNVITQNDKDALINTGYSEDDMYKALYAHPKYKLYLDRLSDVPDISEYEQITPGSNVALATRSSASQDDLYFSYANNPARTGTTNEELDQINDMEYQKLEDLANKEDNKNLDYVIALKSQLGDKTQKKVCLGFQKLEQILEGILLPEKIEELKRRELENAKRKLEAKQKANMIANNPGG